MYGHSKKKKQNPIEKAIPQWELINWHQSSLIWIRCRQVELIDLTLMAQRGHSKVINCLCFSTPTIYSFFLIFLFIFYNYYYSFFLLFSSILFGHINIASKVIGLNLLLDYFSYSIVLNVMKWNTTHTI